MRFSGRPVQGLMMIVGTDSQRQRSKSEINGFIAHTEHLYIHNASSQIRRGRLQNFDTTVCPLTLCSLLDSFATLVPGNVFNAVKCFIK